MIEAALTDSVVTSLAFRHPFEALCMGETGKDLCPQTLILLSPCTFQGSWGTHLKERDRVYISFRGRRLPVPGTVTATSMRY